MGRRADQYSSELGRLSDWDAYLKAHSGLPGPRANLELVEVVGDEAEPDMLWRLSESSGEFLALRHGGASRSERSQTPNQEP